MAVGKFVQRSQLACRVRLRADSIADFLAPERFPLTLSAVGFKIAPRMEALRPKVGIAPIIRIFLSGCLPANAQNLNPTLTQLTNARILC